MKYKSERVDGLLDKARTIYDVAERKKLYADTPSSRSSMTCRWCRSRFGAEYAAMRASVNGFEWVPDEIPRFRGLWKTAG